MLLAGALFALFMTGCWLYCLTEAVLTPAHECRGLSKPAWVAVIAVTFVAGAFAWLIARRPFREQSVVPVPQPAWTDADDVGVRHPLSLQVVSGSPGQPKGPDDDLEFLRALGAAIRRNPPVS